MLGFTFYVVRYQLVHSKTVKNALLVCPVKRQTYVRNIKHVTSFSNVSKNKVSASIDLGTRQYIWIYFSHGYNKYTKTT